MEDQNFCSEWVTLLYPNVLYNVLYECLFIINNFIIIIWKDDVLNTVYDNDNDNDNDSIYWLVKKQHSSLWPIQHR